MTRYFKYIGIGLLIVLSMQFLIAQKTKETPNVYFKNKEAIPQIMAKDTLLGKLYDRLWMNDSTGKMYPIGRYTLTFVERGLFFDEQGKPKIVSEYFDTETQLGIIAEDWHRLLAERLKSGDTIKIVNPTVYLNTAAKDKIVGKNLSIVIQ